MADLRPGQDGTGPPDAARAAAGHAPTLLPGKGANVPPPAVSAADEPTALAAAPPAPPDVPVPGLLLGGRYRLERCIGRGGMGEVWEAVHTVIGRRVAIKLVLPERAASNEHEVIERFLREARVIAAVGHPSVVEILDFGKAPGDRPYYVMELLAGTTLAERVKRQGPLDWSEAVRVLRQVAEGLAAVHERGIVHRDLKPGNIFLVASSDGAIRAKIIDFGIAKSNALDPSARTFTKTGMVFGTPAYMSPEQARGDRVDLRADIYALGCVAFHALTGRLPFPAENATKMLFHHLFSEPRPPSELRPEGAIPPSLDAWVLRCMRKEPDNRFRTMHEAAEALAAVAPQAACVPVPTEASMPIAPLGAGASPAMQTGWATETGGTGPAETAPVAAGRRAGSFGRMLALGGVVGAVAGAAIFAVRLGGGADVEPAPTASPPAAAAPAPSPPEAPMPAAPEAGRGGAAPPDVEASAATAGGAPSQLAGGSSGGDSASSRDAAPDGSLSRRAAPRSEAPVRRSRRRPSERPSPAAPSPADSKTPPSPAPPPKEPPAEPLETWDDLEPPRPPSEPPEAESPAAPPPRKKKPHAQPDGDLIDPGF